MPWQQWSPAPSMVDGRHCHASVSTATKLYVVGGSFEGSCLFLNHLVQDCTKFVNVTFHNHLFVWSLCVGLKEFCCMVVDQKFRATIRHFFNQQIYWWNLFVSHILRKKKLHISEISTMLKKKVCNQREISLFNHYNTSKLKIKPFLCMSCFTHL